MIRGTRGIEMNKGKEINLARPMVPFHPWTPCTPSPLHTVSLVRGMYAMLVGHNQLIISTSLAIHLKLPVIYIIPSLLRLYEIVWCSEVRVVMNVLRLYEL